MTTDRENDRKDSPTDAATEQALDDIRSALKGLKFGQITIIVQDGLVIQVERTERKRLRRKGESP